MIIQFTIGNFLSFKEQSTLSLAASALKEIMGHRTKRILRIERKEYQTY